MEKRRHCVLCASLKLRFYIRSPQLLIMFALAKRHKQKCFGFMQLKRKSALKRLQLQSPNSGATLG
jgi:hypothetical protein